MPIIENELRNNQQIWIKVIGYPNPMIGECRWN